MKVFLSWSKRRSGKLALAFREWLPHVIQALEPFEFSTDIDKGTYWQGVLASSLDQINVGILFVTPENQQQPWLAFEAGALAKHVGVARVTPLLFDVEPNHISGGPLGTLQAAKFDQSEMLKLMQSLNALLRAQGGGLDGAVLRKTFERWWPDLELEVEAIMKEKPDGPVPAPPKAEDMIAEVMARLRTFEAQLSNFTHNIDRSGYVGQASSDAVGQRPVAQPTVNLRRRFAEKESSVSRKLKGYGPDCVILSHLARH
jgi:hypothetical protein